MKIGPEKNIAELEKNIKNIMDMSLDEIQALMAEAEIDKIMKMGERILKKDEDVSAPKTPGTTPTKATAPAKPGTTLTKATAPAKPETTPTKATAPAKPILSAAQLAEKQRLANKAFNRNVYMTTLKKVKASKGLTQNEFDGFRALFLKFHEEHSLVAEKVLADPKYKWQENLKKLSDLVESKLIKEVPKKITII